MHSCEQQHSSSHNEHSHHGQWLSPFSNVPVTSVFISLQGSELSVDFMLHQLCPAKNIFTTTNFTVGLEVGQLYRSSDEPAVVTSQPQEPSHLLFGLGTRAGCIGCCFLTSVHILVPTPWVWFVAQLQVRFGAEVQGAMLHLRCCIMLYCDSSRNNKTNRQ